MSKALKIAAFGASLTEGYYNYGRSFHPYTEKLQGLLFERFKDHKIDVLQEINNFNMKGSSVWSIW